MSNPTSIILTSESESARYAQKIRGHIADDKVVIAVEGDDDHRINRKLFKNVVISPTFGKMKLLNIDKDLFDLYPRNLIAIKDADFDHLNGTAVMHKHIFLTDKHDMEMTMIDCEIVESILAEYLELTDEFENPCDGQGLVSSLSENLKEYSYIKWQNDVEDCRINFAVVSMSSLGTAEGKVTIRKALDKLFANPANNREGVRVLTEDEVRVFMDSHPCDNLSLLTCGHDFCDSMLEWMRKNGLKRNLSSKRIESDIRLLYSPQKFHATTLYQNIHAWEMLYDRDIVA